MLSDHTKTARQCCSERLMSEVRDTRALEQSLTLIRPPSGRAQVNWAELWDYRDLIYFLTWRDIKVRYKQTALGAAWAVLQPFLAMVVFSVFFGALAKVPSEGVPYPVFVYTALV